MGSVGSSRPFQGYSDEQLQQTYGDYMKAGNVEGANAITQEIATRGTVESKPIPKSRVEINDTEFRAYNGRPSGFGTWAFEIGGDTVFYSGKYSDAKKQAIEEAAKRGVSRVKLGT